MKNKSPSPRKNKRFPAPAIFTAAICMCMLFAACKDEPPENKAPTANAGSNQNVTLASDLTVTLNGTASTDPDSSIASYAWECTGYAKHADVVTAYTPSQVTGLIQNASTATATVDLRKAGNYTFKLTVTDNEGATNAKEVTVVVGPQELTKTGYSIPLISGVTSAVNSFSFAQAYAAPAGGWNTDFPSTALTYTLTAEGTSANDTVTSVSSVGRADDEQYLVTQTFHYNGVPIQNGSRNIVLATMSGSFIASLIAKNNFDDMSAPVPALNNLTLRVEKTELP
jgi:hypothetical protein